MHYLTCFSNQSECKNCCLYIIIQRNRAENQIWKVVPNMIFSPDLGGKNGGFPSMRMQVILDSSFAPARVQPLYGAGRKESSGTGLKAYVN